MMLRMQELKQMEATTFLQRQERQFEGDDVDDLPVLLHGSPFDFIRQKVLHQENEVTILHINLLFKS
jgi:hypothetical protein